MLQIEAIRSKNVE